MKNVRKFFENTFDELHSLESIIKLTHEACLEKELDAVYYTSNKGLSEERNHYINMLSIALDKITQLKEINILIEEELTQL